MVRFTENGGEPSDEGLAPVIPLFGDPIADQAIERHFDSLALAQRGSPRDDTRRRAEGSDPVVERHFDSLALAQRGSPRDETRRHAEGSDPVVERAERDETRRRPSTFSEEYWLDEDPAADEPRTPATDDVDEPVDREKLRENAATSLTRSLGRRGLSVSEAQARLRADGLTAEESQAVVDEFVERGWLDDAVLAEQLVHSATTRKGMGTRAIRQLLIKRSVARDVVDEVIGDLPDDDAERALEFARGKARSLVRYDDETATRRLMGMLARRGFGGSVAGKAARTALADERRSAGGSAVRFR